MYDGVMKRDRKDSEGQWLKVWTATQARENRNISFAWGQGEDK